MVPIARRNLLADRRRLAISIAGVAFAVLLVLTILGLYRGWGEAGGIFRDLPGDLWVAQAGTRDPFRSASSLPGGRQGRLAEIPGVAAAVPVRARRIAFRQGGRELDAFVLAFGQPAGAAAAAAAIAPPRGRVIIDEAVARDAGVEEGDVLDLLGHRLVVERVRPGRNPLFGVAMANADDLPGILGSGGTVSFYLVSAAPGADTAALRKALREAVPGAQVSTSAEFAQATGDLVRKGFLPVVGVLVGIGVVIGGAVTALTTYTATVERSRDFGVLKAIGASRAYVVRIVLEQSMIIASAGAVIGLGATLAALAVIERRVPEFVTDLRPIDAAVVMVATVAVSAAAAWLPIRRIAAIDPAIVFRA
jgi:putative ABC transport system permease protein